MLPSRLKIHLGTSIHSNPTGGVGCCSCTGGQSGASSQGYIIGHNPCAQVVGRTFTITYPVKADGILLSSLEVVVASISIYSVISAACVGVGITAIVTDEQTTGGISGGFADIPTINIGVIIHYAPLFVAASGGKVGGVRQREVLVVGNEALGLAPTAVVVLAAAHHHVIPVGCVGRQASDFGAVRGASGYEGRVLLLAGLPVAEGVGAGGADGRMGKGVQRGSGGSDAVGRKHCGHTAGGHGLEGDTLPASTELVVHHRTHPEAIVMVC